MVDSTPFTESVSFLTFAFKYILNYLDNIILFADVSILELNIAFTVFGLLFVALFTVVRAGAVNSGDSVSSFKKEEARKESRRKERESYKKSN